MSQKKKLQPKAVQKPNRRYLVFLVVSIIITLIAYNDLLSGNPKRRHDFVNWDDPVYVIGNPHFTNFSLSKVFTSFDVGNYHPFTMLSLCTDNFLFGKNATYFALHNLLLHLISVVLLFFIFRKLLKNDWYAFFISALFGVHPMHVESVAWISERKDVLHAAWYLAALLVYLIFTETKKSKWLFISLIMFLCALLSKGQAVTFCIVIVLIDWYKQRGWNKEVILEKIPFFILSLVFGLVAMKAQGTDAGGGMGMVELDRWQSLLVGFYGLIRYATMFFVPYPLSCLHPYTFSKGDSLPFILYASPVIVIAVLAGLIYKFRTNRDVIFGTLFFVLTIFPVLQFIPIGRQIIAERYTYIPYIGLSLLLIGLLKHYTSSSQMIAKGILSAMILIFLFQTSSRVRVWQYTGALWTDVLDKYPGNVTAYINRGYWYNQVGRFNQGLADANDGLKQEPKSYKLWENRGVSNYNLKNYPEALLDFSNSLAFNDTNQDALLNRGIIYTDNLKEYDKGIADFRRLLTINPASFNGALNMGSACYMKGDYNLAIKYLEKAVSIDPEKPRPYYLLSICYKELGKSDEAARMMNLAKVKGWSGN